MKSQVLFENTSYVNVRDSIENGDIVFVHGDKNGFHPFRQLIMWATDSQFIHVGIAFTVCAAGENRVMLAEAQGGTRRRIVNLSFYENLPLTVVRTDKKWDEMGPRVLERFGQERYGWIAAIYAGLRDYLSREWNFHLKKRNLPHEICSEFVAKILEMDSDSITPQKLYENIVKATY